MADDAPASPDDRAARFEARLRSDRAAGRLRSIGEYLAEFPDLSFLVADRFAEISVEEFTTRSNSGAAGARGSAPPTTGPPALRQLGRYRIERELGRGGQGVVYLAEDGDLRRKVALKVIAVPASRPDEAIARFHKEAESAARIDHPGICSVYEAGVVGDAAFLAMRYVEGETLARVIARKRDASRGGTPMGAAERDEVLRVVESAARAVHAAHAKGVVHRDIKPANVMIDEDGKPVLLDFGLARQDDPAAPSLTASNDAVGTPAYMAPEQIRSGGGRPDHRCDVYALGAVLYELLLLKRPFEAPTRELLYRAILLEEPSGLGRGPGALSAEVRTVLATALEKDPDRRYRTALDLAEDLARLRAGEPLRARPPGAWRRFVLWQRRHPTAAALLLFAVLAAGVVVALQHRSISDLRTSRDDERRMRTRAEGLRFAAESVAEVERDPALALALALEADARAPGFEARNALYGALLKNRERLTFLAHDDQVTACTLTPDDRIAITGDASGLWLAWEVATGRVLTRLESTPGRPVFAQCSPDGSTVCCALEQGSPWLWRWSESGPVVPIEPQKAARLCAFDSSGHHVLAAAWGEGWTVWDVEAARALAAESNPAVVAATLSADGTRVVAVTADAITIRDLRSGATISVQGHDLRGCARHPRDALFAVTEGNDVVVRRLVDGSVAATVAGAGGASNVASNPVFVGDGSRILARGTHPSLVSWADARVASVFEPSPAPDIGGDGAAPSPNGRRFVRFGATETGAAGIWDDSGRYRGALRGSRYWIASAALSSDASFALVASRDGTARVYSVEDPLSTPRDETARPSFATFDRNGRLLVEERRSEAPDRCRIVAVDGFGGSPPRVVCPDATPVGVVSVDRERRHALQIEGGRRFTLYDLESGAKVAEGSLAQPRVNGVEPVGISVPDFSAEAGLYVGRAWSPQLESFYDFVADFDGSRAPRPVRGALKNFVRLKLSPDGLRTVGADGSDRTATVCDARRGGELARLAGHSGWVVDADWSADGSRIATAAVDSSIRVWRAVDYSLERVMRGLKMAETRLAFSFEGRFLAALAGGQVNLFDVGTGEAIAAIDGFGPKSEHGIPCFTEDDAWLLLSLERHAFRLPLDPVAYARAHLPRALDAKELGRFGIGTREDLVAVLSRLSAESPSARNAYSEGIARLDLGDLAGARRAFQAAAGLRPRHRFGHYGLACVEAAEARTAEALAELAAAVKCGGISVEEIRADPRLAALRAVPGFEEAARGER